MENTRYRYIAGVGWLLGIAATSSCEMAGPRHDPTEKTSVAAAPEATPGSDSVPSVALDAQRTEAPAATAQRCVVPRLEPAASVAPPAARCPADPDGPLALPTGGVRFTDAPGAPRVSVELALDDAARARGLMYRTKLAADAGMLFSWDREQPRSFWMLNTCIPLDMLFIAADGTIVGILEQVPTLNTLPRGVPCPARHVLEVNAGWTRQHGVQPGQKVDFET